MFIKTTALWFFHKRGIFRMTITVFLIFCWIYFALYTFFGSQGLLQMVRLKNEVEEAKAVLSELNIRYQQLDTRVRGLYEESLDLDLLEEQVRFMLGYVSTQEQLQVEKG